MNFLPLDIRDEEDVALVLHHADYIVQYGEDLEPKQPKDDVSAKCKAALCCGSAASCRALFCCAASGCGARPLSDLHEDENMSYPNLLLFIFFCYEVFSTPYFEVQRSPISYGPTLS